MLNELLLLSGNDIPYITARLTIHQPTIKEIAYIGEESFFIGCELLKISKDSLNIQDKSPLKYQDDFDVLMSIMIDTKTPAVQKNRIGALMVLALIFPEYKISLSSKEIILEKDKEKFFINKNNYQEFKEILISMFCLKNSKSEEYNPCGEMSKKIADKFRQRHQKLAELEGPKKISVISRYISILTVGEHKDMNSFMQYTIYQLFDEFQRFELKSAYEIYTSLKLAGAKDLKEVDDWMKDIHS